MIRDFTTILETISLFKGSSMLRFNDGSTVMHPPALQGKMIACDYAGKSREGIVKEVTKGRLLLQYVKNDKTEYRSLSFAGITNLKIV